MAHSIRDIAAALGTEAFGDLNLMIETASEPASAGPNDLALAMSPAYGEKLPEGQARAAVVWPGCDWQSLGLEAAITVPRARLAMSKLTQLLDTDYGIAPGIHPTAVVDGAEIGEGVAIGPFVYIAPGATIGAGTRIAAHCSIASSVEVGHDCLILDGVRLMRRVVIGDRVILQPNAVIGGDGFSFVTEQETNAEIARRTMGTEPLVAPEDATQHRIHSLGGVVIEEDVEIGASTCIDAGTIRPTRVSARTKMDNLCHIGHNVVIGRDCVIAGQSAVAGSAVIGDRVVMGGRVGVSDNITIGEDCVLTGATILLSSVPKGRVMMGHPGTKMTQQVEMYKALRRLPRTLNNLAKRQKSDS